MKDGIELRPTLWRTVRAVLNEQRLRLLRDVFAHDGEFCVRQIARRAGIDDPIASIYLRQMNARGLLGVRRDRINVYYNTDPDRSLPEAIAFQTALRTFLTGRLERGWELKLVTVLRGFSHFNRLAMLIRLARGPAGFSQLKESVGIGVKMFYHHLHFLRCAGLVDTAVADSKESFVLVRPEHPVAECLMKLLLADAYATATYYNPDTGCKTDRAEKAVLKHRAKRKNLSGDPWRERKTMTGRMRMMKRDIRSALLEPEG